MIILCKKGKRYLKTLLFAPETFNLAETTRMIEVAKTFKEEANCIFIGYSTEFSYLIEKEGFTFNLLTPYLSNKQIKEIMAFDQGKSLKNPFNYSLLKERIESEISIINQINPDAIIIGSTISLLISARHKKIPLIYVKPFALSRGHIESNSFLKNNIMRKTIQSIALKIKWLPKDMKKLIEEYQVTRFFPYTIDALDADLNCITTPDIFTNYAKLPKNSHYVGPIFANLDSPIPEKVYELLKQNKKPTIFCSLGSSANTKIVYQVLQNFSGLDVEVISPMKYFLSDDQINSLPSNVHLFDWLPAKEIQSQVTASVLHGGEGTIQTACVSGKPFIGIGLQTEQRYNISTCVSYGNALNYKSSKIKNKKIFQQCVLELLSQENLYHKAQTLKNYFDKEKNGTLKTYQLINSYLSKN